MMVTNLSLINSIHSMIEALYRGQDEQDSESLERERLGEMEEVSGLPDLLSPGGSSSQVVSRVRKKQEEKHERAREEFRDRLSELSTEYERKITEASYSLKEHMDGMTEQIDELTRPLADRDTLLSQSYSQLESVWSQINTLSTLHQSSIDTFSETLSEMERKKSSALNVTFSRFSERFIRVGFLTPPQCVSLLEEEAWKMNHTLIENQRSCNQLLFRLRASYIAHEKKYRDDWLSLVEQWRELRVETAVEEFAAFMSDPAVQKPPQFDKLLKEMSNEQNIINKERIEQIFSTTNLKPPIVCSLSVRDWEMMVRKIHDKLESLNTRYLVMLHDCQSRVHEYCLEEATAVKNRLVSDMVCEEDDVFHVMNERLLPPIEDLQSTTEDLLQTIERTLDALLSSQRSQLDEITDFIGDGLLLWQQHQNGLINKERQIQEKLETTRTEHNEKNQQLESSLDIWLDKLRQASGKDDLKHHFNQAMKYLCTISEGYTEFQQQMESLIEDYPLQISSLLSLYEESVMKGLSIAKQPPRVPRKMRSDLINSGRITRVSSTGSGTGKASVMKAEPILTDSGTTYYWMIRSETVWESTDSVFITQAANKCNTFLDIATKNVKLPNDFKVGYKKSLIKAYLSHMEVWRDEGVERARTVVGAKNEELSSELELRLHLHEPRVDKINQDIRTAREEELMEHENDYREHTRMIENAIDKQKCILHTELTPTIENMTSEYRKKLKEIESHISSLSKHAQLQAVVEVAETTKSAHVRTLKSLVKKFRVSVEDTLHTLKESDAIYRNSLETFSEGKNFAPEEIETFSHGLESVMKNIDVFETSIKSEVDTLQSHHYQVALDVFGKLSDKFEHNLLDINFMERINAKFSEIQLQIRIEIAASNSQAEDIQHHLLLLSQLVGSLQNKFEDMHAPDYELIDCAVDELYRKTQARIDYLFCFADNTQPSVLLNFQEVTSDVISTMVITRPIIQAPSRTNTPSTEPPATPSLLVPDADRRQTSACRKSTTSRLSTDRPHMLHRRKGLNRYQLLKNPEFGTEGGNDTNNPSSLLPKIRKLLYSKNAEFIQMCDGFYKTRNSKSILHIDSLPETSEMCMLNVNKRLHSYRAQLEEYRIQCIQELRGQLEKLFDTLSCLPLAVFSGILFQITLVLYSEKKQLIKTFAEKFTKYEELKESYRAQLRPNLGHVNNKEILDKLCQSEEERHASAVQDFANFNASKMEQLTLSGESFNSQLEDRLTFMCNLFQKVILPSAIVKVSEKETKQLPTSVLQLDALPEDTPHLKMCIDIPKEWYKMGIEKLERLSLTPTLHVPNITELYTTLFENRDSIFLAFFKDFISEHRENTEGNLKRISREDIAYDSWDKSVIEIKSLFI